MKTFTALLHISLLSTITCSAQGPPTVKAILRDLGISLDLTSLRTALTDPRARVRSFAAAELAEQKYISAIPDLEIALNYERDHVVRYTIASSLVQLGNEQGYQVVKTTCESDEDSSMRLMAAIDLDYLRSDYSCAPSMLGLLASGDVTLREGILLYLVRVPASEKNAAPFGPILLDAALHDSFPYNQELAAKALKQLGDPASQAAYIRQVARRPAPPPEGPPA